MAGADSLLKAEYDEQKSVTETLQGFKKICFSKLYKAIVQNILLQLGHFFVSSILTCFKLRINAALNLCVGIEYLAFHGTLSKAAPSPPPYIFLRLF